MVVSIPIAMNDLKGILNSNKVELPRGLQYRAGNVCSVGEAREYRQAGGYCRAVALLVSEKLLNYDHERFTFPIPLLHGRLRGLPCFGIG